MKAARSAGGFFAAQDESTNRKVLRVGRTYDQSQLN
jgi:hypothetical protein